jgi:hypothetical protein
VEAKQWTLRILAIISLLAGSLVGAMTSWRWVVAAVHFVQGNSINPWFLLIQVWLSGLAAYLIFVGLRRIRGATEEWKNIPKIGWGKVLLGSYLIISPLANLFHAVPNSLGKFQLEPSNEIQAEAVKNWEQITNFTMPFVGAALIVAGIRDRFKKRTQMPG